jgi:hypothetical protein
MSNSYTQENGYPFTWLDEVVEVKLNPALSPVGQIAAQELEQIRQQLPGEARQVQYSLKTRTLSLCRKTEIQAVAEQYYWFVTDLLRQASANLDAYAQHTLLLQTGQALIEILGQLVAYIRRIYLPYLPELPPESPVLPASLPAYLVKLLILLSVDRIGIVVRAAYKAGIIGAKSVRAAFRLLAPFVSTEIMEEVSGDSMRSNSGRPDAADLDAVIALFYQLIEIVKGFYRR